MAFAVAGARVVCVVRRQADVSAVVGEINDGGNQKMAENKEHEHSIAVAADVSGPDTAVNVIRALWRPQCHFGYTYRLCRYDTLQHVRQRSLAAT